MCLPTFAQEPSTEQLRGLAAVKARGELLWGADAQGGAPYVFQDPMDPNRLIGFEVDLAWENGAFQIWVTERRRPAALS